MKTLIKESTRLINASRYTTAFTGAGISVESGIPPFRGEKGIWNKYDPQVLDINYFFSNPKESWSVIKEIFYDHFGIAEPNFAHIGLAQLEKENKLKEIITQNIDNLHQKAGSKKIHEFHGNSMRVNCTSCSYSAEVTETTFSTLPVLCPKCKQLVKPDFIFFGEAIPTLAYQNSVQAAQQSEVMIVIGSTGEVMPACQMPLIAKQNGATIIEINLEESKFTNSITDIFIQGKASEVIRNIINHL